MVDAIKRLAGKYATSVVWAVVFCWLVAPHVVIANLQLAEQQFGVPQAMVDLLKGLIAVLWPLGTVVLAVGAIVCLMRTTDAHCRDAQP